MRSTGYNEQQGFSKLMVIFVHLAHTWRVMLPEAKGHELYELGRARNVSSYAAPLLLKFSESTRVEHITVNCSPSFEENVPPLLHWRTFDHDVIVLH